MKKVLGILLFITILTPIIMAQSKGYKEIKRTERSEVINVSADRLWEIVGPGFEHAGRWSTAVDHSVGSGVAEFDGATCSARACDLNAKGFNKINEVITLYKEETQELAYDVIEGNPGFVLKANNHWKVIEIGPNQSLLEMTLTMHLKKFMGTLMGGMLKKNIDSLIPSIFNDLKIYAETGDVSEEKKARMEKIGTQLQSVK